MHLTTKTKPFRRSERRSKALNRTRRAPAPEPRPRPALPVSQVRARRGSGIEDRALYSCECGFTWKGEVTASPVLRALRHPAGLVVWRTADLTVIALGRAEASASAYIAEIQRRLAAQDRVRYELHAMGTSLEGATADILAVVGELHAVPFELGIPRVYSILKLDERRDREQTLADKVESVRRRLES